MEVIKVGFVIALLVSAEALTYSLVKAERQFVAVNNRQIAFGRRGKFDFSVQSHLEFLNYLNREPLPHNDIDVETNNVFLLFRNTCSGTQYEKSQDDISAGGTPYTIVISW